MVRASTLSSSIVSSQGLAKTNSSISVKILRSVSYSSNLCGSGPCIRHASPGDPCRKLELSANAVAVKQVSWTTAKQRLSKEGESRLSKTKQFNKRRSGEKAFVPFLLSRLPISFIMRRSAAMMSYNIGQILRGRNALYTINTQLRNHPEGPWLATYIAPFIASCDPFPNLY